MSARLIDPPPGVDAATAYSYERKRIAVLMDVIRVLAKDRRELQGEVVALRQLVGRGPRHLSRITN